MSANQAKEIKVEVSDISESHPISVNVNLSVGNFASANITMDPSNTEAMKEAVSPTSKDVFNKIKEDQNFVNDVGGRFVYVDVSSEDLDTEPINFAGDANCPVYSFSVAGVSYSNNVIAECARMNSVDLSIYKIDVKYLRTADIVKTPPEDLSLAIGDILYEIYGKSKKETSQDENIKNSIEKTDAINQKNVGFAVDLFRASYGYMGWDKLGLSLGKAAWAQCVFRIVNILQSNTGGFFNAILQLASEFQCIYIPDPSGRDPGKLVNKLKIFENPVPVCLNIINMNLSAGYKDMNGIGAVTVVSPAMPKKYLRTVPASKLVFTYPEDVDTSVGTVLQIPGPPWLSEAVYNKFRAVEAAANAKKNDQSIGKKKEERSEAEEKAQEKLPTVSDLLKQWAKSEYYWQCLGQTYCVVTCEFNNLEVGKYYMVYNEEGDLLFNGFLYSISHDISSNIDSAQARTILNFSHVRVAGLEIRGLD